MTNDSFEKVLVHEFYNENREFLIDLNRYQNEHNVKFSITSTNEFGTSADFFF